MHAISRLIFIMFTILILHGCVTAQKKTAGMRQMMELNRNDMALIEAERHLAAKTQGVMENMNAGLLRRLNRDYKGSNQAFEIAKLKIEELYSTSVTEQVGSVLLNDETISFEGDRFEQVLIHLYMASNYMSLGDIDSSRVELLQAQVKMNEWGEPENEVPFMRYFSGIMFEILGEEDAATVSYRKAVETYELTQSKHGVGVPHILKKDLLRMLARMNLWNEYKTYKKKFNLPRYKRTKNKGKGELIVIFANGLAPQKEEKTFQTWSTELSLNIKIAVPDYPNPPIVLNRIRLRIDNKTYPLELVSNIDGLARSSLDDDMTIITARAIARAVVKKKAEIEAGEKGGMLGQFAMLAFNHITEIADTRSWNTLPQEFELGRVFLPKGKHKVQIEVLSSTGQVIDVINRNVTIKPGTKSIISKRWTSPERMNVTKVTSTTKTLY